MSKSNPRYTKSSFFNKSAGSVLRKKVEAPNKTFVHVRKKNVGPSKYRNTIRMSVKRGKRSKKKEKNKTSATNMMEPGNPKKTSKLNKLTKKSLGQRKLRPFTSVTNRVLNRRPTASTNKNEFVDNSAWLMSIQKLARNKGECPLITHIANQCISTTVE